MTYTHEKQIINYADCHLHILDKRFDERIKDIISSARKLNISRLVSNGTSEEDWSETLELANRYTEIIPFIGLHPWHVETASSTWADSLIELLSKSKAGVGECGLDLSKRFKTDSNILKKQERAFLTQIDIANSLKRPISLHIVHAWEWFFKLTKEKHLQTKIQLHAFSGSKEIARKFYELPAFFSCAANTIFNTTHYPMLKELPLSQILIETDSPDLSQQRGVLNTPSEIPRYVKELAKIREIDEYELASIIQENLNNFLAN